MEEFTMGAIWDFISGKSTDWDEVDAKNEAASRRAAERQAERERDRPKRIVKCYCKICGEYSTCSDPNNWNQEVGWIKSLQSMNFGCGRGCHIPEFVWE